MAPSLPPLSFEDVRTTAGQVLSSALPELAQAVAQRLAALGLRCSVDVSAGATVRVLVPGLPDPEVSASLHAAVEWDGADVRVHVLARDVQLHLVPEGRT